MLRNVSVKVDRDDGVYSDPTGGRSRKAYLAVSNLTKLDPSYITCTITLRPYVWSYMTKPYYKYKFSSPVVVKTPVIAPTTKQVSVTLRVNPEILQLSVSDAANANIEDVYCVAAPALSDLVKAPSSAVNEASSIQKKFVHSGNMTKPLSALRATNALAWFANRERI